MTSLKINDILDMLLGYRNVSFIYSSAILHTLIYKRNKTKT